VHAGLASAAELVPVIARELELRTHRHLELDERDEVFEARLAGDLLREEPSKLVVRRARREALEQGIALTGTVVAQGLEPAHERLGLRWRALCRRSDASALRLEERPLEPPETQLIG